MLNDKKYESLIKGLKKLGFKYVTLDLQGYKMGNLNKSS